MELVNNDSELCRNRILHRGVGIAVLLCVADRPTGLMSEPLMAPPQLKPSAPLLHKEPPILIKQASLDKNKAGKKDKVS